MTHVLCKGWVELFLTRSLENTTQVCARQVFIKLATSMWILMIVVPLCDFLNLNRISVFIVGLEIPTFF